MKLGFIIPPDLPGLTLAELAPWAVQNGFQAVDVREVNDEVVRTCQEHGLEIGALHV